MVRGYPTPQVTWKRMIKSSSSSSPEGLSGLSDHRFVGNNGDSASSSVSSDQVSTSGQQYHLIRSGPDYQVYENGSLRITTSSSEDLLCTASNGIGPGISKAVRLTVNGLSLFTFYSVAYFIYFSIRCLFL
jgi:hypothetical protein